MAVSSASALPERKRRDDAQPNKQKKRRKKRKRSDDDAIHSTDLGSARRIARAPVSLVESSRATERPPDVDQASPRGRSSFVRRPRLCVWRTLCREFMTATNGAVSLGLKSWQAEVAKAIPDELTDAMARCGARRAWSNPLARAATRTVAIIERRRQCVRDTRFARHEFIVHPSNHDADAATAGDDARACRAVRV